ncbi:hypothetical protein N7454_003236 [Penicillium verhagenii]|nr:hypothetical protein N7454_003236 [Penicillium verhagenii]
MDLDDSNELWAEIGSPFQFPSDEDILAAAMNDVAYDASVSSDLWQPDFAGHHALTYNFIHLSEETQEKSQNLVEHSPTPPAHIRKFYEFHNLYSDTFQTDSNASEETTAPGVSSEQNLSPHTPIDNANRESLPSLAFESSIVPPSNNSDTIEKVNKCLDKLENRLQEFENRFDRFNNSIETLQRSFDQAGGNITDVKTNIKTLDGYLLEIIRREREAMDRFQQLQVDL